MEQPNAKPQNETRATMVAVSRKLSDLMMRHEQGEPVYAEMAARIEERRLNLEQ